MAILILWLAAVIKLTSTRITLHRIGFPAILTKRVVGEIGYKQRTLIKDVEYDKHAQLRLVWIEASECLYPDMRKGACEKCIDDGP